MNGNNEILYLLLDDYADHESVFLSTAVSCDERGMKSDPMYVNRVVAPTLDTIRSCSGFRTVPDYSFATMPDSYAALVLIGGYGWIDADKCSPVAPIVADALKKGITVGAICNSASFMASHGFLNDVRHTGNGLDQLKSWGGDRYTGEAMYVDAQAVSDRGIVTANGTASLEFARELLLLLGSDTPERIEKFYRFNKEGFAGISSGK